MMFYSYNDHFQFGFNGEPWSDWHNLNDRFFVQYGRPEVSRHAWPWRVANNSAAELLYGEAKKINKQVAVCFSGGVDSQVVALAFKDALVPVELWHFQTGHPFETRTVRDFAEQHQLPLKVVPIDVPEFFLSGENKHYQTITPILHGTYELHCKMMDLVVQSGSVPIYGEGSLTRLLGQTWGVGEGHTYKTTTRYARAMKYDAVPTFFNYMPEQTHAYCRSNFIRHLTMGLQTNIRIGKGNQIECLPTRFDGDVVHHVKMALIAEQYPEAKLIRKQVGHEQFAGQPWYEDNLGRGRLKQWGAYMQRHYLRFDMFEPNTLALYMEGKRELDEARIPYGSTNFWRYPE